MFGHSPNLREAARRIQQVAPTDISVLVTGPSGSGKELIARAIHNNSPRADREYISLNCASIPEALLESELFGYEKGAFTGADRTQPGLLQQAHGGTLFLDEIGEMHPRLQAKLLRAIDTKTFMAVGGRKTTAVDVRFIAATNRDLQSEVEAGNFRADLYYRLSVITIQMQRLSERPEDILPIIAHNLGRLKSNIRFSPEATELLLRYSWPGNVRELTNFLQRLLVTNPSGEVSRETVASLLDKHRLDDRSLPVVTNLTAEESGYRLIYQALLNLANEVIDLKRLIHERLGGAVPAQPQAVHTEQSGGDLEAMEEQLIRETLQRVGGNRKKAATILGIGERTLYRKLRKFNLM
ncbi:MAG: sigma-54-dependent Fis family transcriptional regulator [candidate division Zixibacteria bacterium]|nr:sigma-54-dependent Fis family transcriptional regulator [candidate division Zixibacteria bacterium]